MSIPTPTIPRPGQHFTAFFSAAEETLAAGGRQECRDSEGGHMSSLRGRVIRTPDALLPYAAILTHDGRAESARAFASMRAAEAFIRRNTPVPAPRPTLYDRAAGDI
jgi:hypothetical protein